MKIIDTAPEPLRFSLDFIGKGTGSSKTTTVQDGPTLAEEFSVGDEVFAHWLIPDYIDRYQDIEVEVHCYINTSESGKLASMEVDVGASDSVPVNQINGTLQDTDISVVSTAYIDFHFDFILDHSVYMPNKNEDALTFRFRRIASSNDPTADIRVHLIELTARA